MLPTYQLLSYYLSAMDHVFGKSFSTYQDAYSFIINAAAETGFVTSIKGYKPNKAAAHTVIIQCDKARAPRATHQDDTHETKRRRASSKRTNCPWRLTIRQPRASALWVMQRINSDTANTHNHELLRVHTSAAYRKTALRKRGAYILREYNLGTRPAHILQSIRACNKG